MITAHQFAENKVTPQQSSFLHNAVTTGDFPKEFGVIQDNTLSVPEFFLPAPLYISSQEPLNRAFPNVNYKFLKITPIFTSPTDNNGPRPLHLRVIGWSSVVQGKKALELLVPNVLAEVTLFTSQGIRGAIPSVYQPTGEGTTNFYTATDIEVVPDTTFTSLPLFYNDVTGTNPSYFIIDTQGAQWLDFEVMAPTTDPVNTYIGEGFSAFLSPYSL